MIINRLIDLGVEIDESDVKAVISLGGELVDFSEAQPQFTWSKYLFYSHTSPIVWTQVAKKKVPKKDANFSWLLK